MIWWLIKWDDGTIGWSADSRLNEGVFLVKEQEQPFSRVAVLSVSPGSTLDFGTVKPGEYKDYSIAIQNDSASTGLLTGSISVSGTGFKLLGSSSFQRLPGERRIITVRFQPPSSGDYSGTLSITHNATNYNSPITYSLEGKGSSDAKSVNINYPLSLNFGSIKLNNMIEQILRIENLNTSTDKLIISNIEVSGEGFKLSSGQPASLELSPGSSSEIKIQFQPTQEKLYSGTLTFEHNATNKSSPISVSLYGSGTTNYYILTVDTNINSGATIWVNDKSYTLPYKGQFAEGSSVTLKAEASGYDFSGWTGDINSANHTLTISMIKDINLKANFVAKQSNKVILNLNVSPLNSGKIRAKINNTWTDWRDSITEEVSINATVEIEAQPAIGFEFLRWAGEIPPGNSPYASTQIVMDRKRDITAMFKSLSSPSKVLHGVDVSAFTGEVPIEAWQNMRQIGYEFVIVQAWGATPSGRGKNPYAQQQLQNARLAGMRTAIYCVVYFDMDGREQVQKAIEAIGDEKNYISFIALDIEKYTGWNNTDYPTRVQRIKEAIKAVEDAGYKVVIYTGWGHWKDMMNNNQEFGIYPLWDAYWDGIADLNKDKDKNDVVRDYFIAYGGWKSRLGKQFAGDQKVNGYTVDLNVFDPSAFDVVGPQTSTIPTPVIAQPNKNNNIFTSDKVMLKLSFEHAKDWVLKNNGQTFTVVTYLENKNSTPPTIIDVSDKSIKIDGYYCYFEPDIRLLPGDYGVKVKLIDQKGNQSKVSEERKFTLLPTSSKFLPPFKGGYVLSGNNDFGTRTYSEDAKAYRWHAGIDIKMANPDPSDPKKIAKIKEGEKLEEYQIIIAPEDGRIIQIYGVEKNGIARILPVWSPGDTTLEEVDIYDFVKNYPDRDYGNHGYGITIIMEHKIEEKKIYTLYAHLRAVSKQAYESWRNGQMIPKETPIGLMGNSWKNYRSADNIPDPRKRFGKHLHFEIRTNTDEVQWEIKGSNKIRLRNPKATGQLEGYGYMYEKDKMDAKKYLESVGYIDPQTLINNSAKKGAFISRQNNIEGEPNDSFDTAIELSPGSTDAVIQSNGDVDFFKFRGEENQTFSIFIEAERNNSLLDAILTLYDNEHNILALNDDDKDRDTVDPAIWRFRLPYTGIYYIKVESVDGTGSEKHFYRLYLRQEVDDDFGDSFDTATTLSSSNHKIEGTIGHHGDVDVFKFEAAKGEYLNLDVRARRDNSPLDPVTELYNSASVLL
jgi:uncharacterized repeat protein (TIGR02543 family)